MFLLTSCNAPAKNIVPKTKGITFTTNVSYYNESYECEVLIEQNGDTSVSIISPDDIKGLTFKFVGNETSVNYGNLNFTLPQNSPEQSVADFIYKVFEAPNETVIKDGDEFYVEGKTKDYEYKLYLGATGLPLKITESTKRYQAIIKNPTIKKEK